MFPPEQEASLGRFNGVNQSNACEPPPPPGGAIINLPRSLDPPPSYSIQSDNHFTVSNAQSPYFVPSDTLARLAVSMKYHQTFLKGKPRALGIVLIVTAVLQIVLGIVQVLLWSSIAVSSGIPFWGSVFYILAGALSIAAETRPSPCLIRGSLSMNIMTSIISAVAMILCSLDIFFVWAFRDCHGYYENGYYEKCWSEKNASIAISSLILVTDVLLFCVSVSINVFGCRSLTYISGVPQVLVIQNTVTLPAPSPTTPLPGFVPTTSEAFIQPPPPYVKYLNPGEAAP